MIPNANGGLRVGLGVEPTVSYSSRGKRENAYKCLLGFLEDIYYFTEEKGLNIIKNIIEDYEKLIKTSIQIPLSNGDCIKFVFNPQDLPHLLGLQHLVDNQYLFEYNEKRLSATELYNRMCSQEEDRIDTDEFEKSSYFEELYKGRIRYFSSEMILDIIKARQIIRFDATKVKNFTTKLDKIEYMFWKKYKDEFNNYGYFGIGFMSSGKESDTNYPNTFFFRMDDEYICHQEIVLPYSMMKRNKYGEKTFEIYWEEVWKSLQKNTHYKKLKKTNCLEDGTLDFEKIKRSTNEETKKQYELLELDSLDVIYLPYMNKEFRWTNDEKRFVLQKMKEHNYDYYPSEIKQLLNEYRQRQQGS